MVGMNSRAPNAQGFGERRIGNQRFAYSTSSQNCKRREISRSGLVTLNADK